MRRRHVVLSAIVVVAVLAAVVTVDASTRNDGAAPSAVARTLPTGYRLLLTAEYEHGAVHVAHYGKRGTEPADAPLTIASVRGGRNPANHDYDYEPHRGDGSTTVRGHPAILRTLTDEDQPYARELVWKERPGLVVAVTADFPVRKRKLPEVAEGVRIIDQPAWASLHMQTSYAAIIGHVTRDLRRLHVKRGRIGGHRWTLFALIPRHYPLSRDDLRVSCYELSYRGRHRNGLDCGPGPNWRRVGGRIFVFGATSLPLRHVRIRPWRGTGLDLTIRTVLARRGPRVRYYATPLPEGICAVSVSGPREAARNGSVAAPIRGRDAHRCAHASG